MPDTDLRRASRAQGQNIETKSNTRHHVDFGRLSRCAFGRRVVPERLFGIIKTKIIPFEDFRIDTQPLFCQELAFLRRETKRFATVEPEHYDAFLTPHPDSNTKTCCLAADDTDVTIALTDFITRLDDLVVNALLIPLLRGFRFCGPMLLLRVKASEPAAVYGFGLGP